MSLCLFFVLGVFVSATKLEPGHVNKDYDSVEEVKSHVSPSTTERPTEKEHLLLEAIADVAYYLRRFKFTGFDPRYPGNMQNLFAQFPSPPLRNIHWEVKKNCEPSFVECVKYLQEQVNQAALPRRSDSLTITKRNGWSFITDTDLIKSADDECLRLLQQDRVSSAPFFGPLDKYRWLASALYYMCLYTMRETPLLKKFVETCDNYASCVDWHQGSCNGDVRANNYRPFACAAYSFCPDPCYPVMFLSNTSDCSDFESNPCAFHALSNKTCRLFRKENTDLESMMLNQWNVSCYCDRPGLRWESKSGMCVDVDECVELNFACDYPSETCRNLPGSFKCECSMLGYRSNSKTMTCESDPLLYRVLYPTYSTPNVSKSFKEKLRDVANRFKPSKIRTTAAPEPTTRRNKTS